MAQASLDAMVNSISALRLLAVALMKIANDIRWLGSDFRAGIHELVLPETNRGLLSCLVMSILLKRGYGYGMHTSDGK